MDNVCHTLVGMAVARAGFRERTALATTTAAIAANLPDLDVLVFATDVPSVAFRRGITHGVPAQVLLPIACAGIMWQIGRRRERAGGIGTAPHFGWLLALSCIGILTHVFLDFLNTYGIRLLSPLSQRWFYGDAVFIVDVWLWLILGAGVVMARRSRPRFAAAALTAATLYVCGMLVSAAMARRIVHDAWVARTGVAPRAFMVGPVPLTPFRREIIIDAGDRYVEGSFRWMPTQVFFKDAPIPKNDAHPAVQAARQDPVIRGILVWSRFPAWDTRSVPAGVEVRLRDMRFRGIDRGGFSATTVVPH
ncbi:MAG: metal-dependent hydrolase [Acidobacteria bacterium]|nr:metal-dependent hydrolase [Acidobacteriota bacterium]